MFRLTSIPLAALLIVPALFGSALVPAPVAPIVGTDPATHVTFFLHSLAPVGDVETSATFAVGGFAPTMDTSAPTGPAPKVIGSETGLYFVAADSPNFGYWDGAVHADVTNVRATLYLAGAGPATIELWADGAPVASVKANVTNGAPITVALPDAGPVGSTLRLRVSSLALAILYDSTTTPASLSFDASPYTAPVTTGGTLPAASPGWRDVALAGVTALGRESSLAIDPTNEQRIFMCTPTGVPNTEYGHSFFSASTDGGLTWAQTQVETDATDTREYTFEGGDCDVAFGGDGTMYTADTWLGDLSVGHSTDGVAWSGTAVATTAPVVDRPWLVGGPGGTVHLSYQDVQFGMPTAIWYAKSTDHGQTFSAAVPVVLPKGPAIYSWEGNYVVTPDQQSIYLVYTTRLNGVVGVQGRAEDVWVASSHDAGVTWTQNHVSSRNSSASYLYPSIGLDAAGGLHVVFAQNTTSDQPVFYSYSSDQAQTWSTPVKVRAGSGAFAPWVVGGNTAGSAAIAWLGVNQSFADASKPLDWFVFTARVAGANAGTPSFTVARTTAQPLYHGNQTMPEFIQLRLDSQDRIHVGAAAFLKQGTATNWGLWHQRET